MQQCPWSCVYRSSSLLRDSRMSWVAGWLDESSHSNYRAEGVCVRAEYVDPKEEMDRVFRFPKSIAAWSNRSSRHIRKGPSVQRRTLLQGDPRKGARVWGFWGLV